MRLAFFPSIRVATSSSFVASPHISLCLPTCHTSPLFTKDAFSSAAFKSKSSSSTSDSSSDAKRSAISCSSNPVRLISKFSACNASISIRSNSSSHPASIAIRLSAIIYAFFCAGVRWSANTHGTSSMPSSFAAMILPCPAITL